ncbi:hypothetical protein [Bifidobacterium stellenboschense]|uniref:hypothetical protein n=1 Tax=Bifidobacterium stellenboschense TaxID=762211 RepID=UPI0012EBE5D0|nr:hypothetical protein [Bifidobacterium stellenboschense]
MPQVPLPAQRTAPTTTSTTVSTPTSTPTRTKRRPAKRIIAAIVAVIVVLLAVDGWLLYRSRTVHGPSGAAIEFLDAYRNGDETTVTNLLAANGTGGKVSLGGMTAPMRTHLSYDLHGKGLTCSGTCTIKATITNVDFARIATDKAFMDKYAEAAAKAGSGQGADARKAEQQATKLFNDKLSATNAPTKRYEVDMQLVEHDGDWKVRMTADLSNALLGGFPEYAANPANDGTNGSGTNDANESDGQ